MICTGFRPDTATQHYTAAEPKATLFIGTTGVQLAGQEGRAVCVPAGRGALLHQHRSEGCQGQGQTDTTAAQGYCAVLPAPGRLLSSGRHLHWQ